MEEKLYDALMKSKEVLKIMEENKGIIDELREKTGWMEEFRTLDDMWRPYDSLNCEVRSIRGFTK